MRLALGADGAPAIDPQAPGRGAWVCGGDDACLLLALRRSAVSRALRTEVGPASAARLRDEWARRFPPGSPDARD